MKTLLFVSALLAGIASVGTPAVAQNYPWCAQYSGRGGGARNCGFTTFDQCMATVSGIGGLCLRNTTYVPTVARPIPRTRVRRRLRHRRARR